MKEERRLVWRFLRKSTRWRSGGTTSSVRRDRPARYDRRDPWYLIGALEGSIELWRFVGGSSEPGCRSLLHDTLAPVSLLSSAAADRLVAADSDDQGAERRFGEGVRCRAAPLSEASLQSISAQHDDSGFCSRTRDEALSTQVEFHRLPVPRDTPRLGPILAPVRDEDHDPLARERQSPLRSDF